MKNKKNKESDNTAEQVQELDIGKTAEEFDMQWATLLKIGNARACYIKLKDAQLPVRMKLKK